MTEKSGGVGLMPSITIGGNYGSDQMVLSAKDAKCNGTEQVGGG